MPHVDEGQLHALLDGAYDEREARSIQEHIAACAECTARLESEQAVRARASAILAGAQPARLGTPPFEIVIEKAKTAGRARLPIPSATRLAWAASIVLALGLGWFSSTLTQAYRADVEQVVPVSQVQPLDAPSPSPAPPAPPASSAAVDDPRRVQEAARAVNERSSGEAVARVKDMAATIEGETKKEATKRDTMVDQLRRRASLFADSMVQRKAVAQGANQVVRPDGRVLGVPVPTPVLTAASGAPVSDDRARLSALWQTVSLDRARTLARRPILLVPDLEVTAVTVSQDGSRVVVRVTQRLFDQSALELTQEPVPMSAAAEQMTPPRQQQQQREQSSSLRLGYGGGSGTPVVRRSDGVAGWEMTVLRPDVRITGRANVPEDSLRAIMSRLREAEVRR